MRLLLNLMSCACIALADGIGVLIMYPVFVVAFIVKHSPLLAWFLAACMVMFSTFWLYPDFAQQNDGTLGERMAAITERVNGNSSAIIENRDSLRNIYGKLNGMDTRLTNVESSLSTISRIAWAFLSALVVSFFGAVTWAVKKLTRLPSGSDYRARHRREDAA